ncbi:MAG: Jag N-terminal domain-containing protein [Campylobacterales bacterium]|nr:Jag N-terminal domain-containing protein [Campylobacterales bacterium]
MPKIFEAKTLEEAYELASNSLECSVVDLHIEVVQYPSRGIFGLFSKKAIIKAKGKYKNHSNKNHNDKMKVESFEEKINSFSPKPKATFVQENATSQIKESAIFNDFYSANGSNEKVVQLNLKDKQSLKIEIEHKINELFSHICYDIDTIKVDILDENTVYIEFNGNDSALLIGKEGYRYKALSYILFNWINEKYGMMLKLEIASFLKNQIESVHTYLEPVIETIHAEGFYKTKTFDGILVHIALSKLRQEFPNKYVAVKTNQMGEKYILVNEYKNNQ